MDVGLQCKYIFYIHIITLPPFHKQSINSVTTRVKRESKCRTNGIPCSRVSLYGMKLTKRKSRIW